MLPELYTRPGSRLLALQHPEPQCRPSLGVSVPVRFPCADIQTLLALPPGGRKAQRRHSHEEGHSWEGGGPVQVVRGSIDSMCTSGNLTLNLNWAQIAALTL